MDEGASPPTESNRTPNAGGPERGSQSMWDLSSAGRASALQAEGQEFDSPHLHHPDTQSGKHLNTRCLLFENCIEEKIRKKNFINMNFSDVPKETQKIKRNLESQEGQGVNLTQAKIVRAYGGCLGDICR